MQEKNYTWKILCKSALVVDNLYIDVGSPFINRLLKE